MKLTVYVCFREDRSEELRKVHESKMLYLNKTQTDKVEKIQLLIQHFLHLNAELSLTSVVPTTDQECTVLSLVLPAKQSIQMLP